MEHYTPEQIAKYTDDLNGVANIKAINKMFRDQDESNLWPISGKFNATNRAIKKAQWFCRETGESKYGLEYALLIDSILSEIVNMMGG
jgi:hypothetical protein